MKYNTKGQKQKMNLSDQKQRPKTSGNPILLAYRLLLQKIHSGAAFLASRRIQGITALFLIIPLGVFIFLPTPASAVSLTPIVPCGITGSTEFGRPCTICDLGVLVGRITEFFVWDIAIPFAGLMIVVGGAMIMFGAASESRVTAGKKILTTTIIGLVFVFVAWIGVDTIIKILTGDA